MLAAAAPVLVACGGPRSAAPAEATRTQPPATEEAWFREIPAALDFRHAAGTRGDYHVSEIMGSGGALFDADADGDLDLYLIDAGAAASGPSVNRMYRQEDDGSFRDVTAASGLGDPGYGMGAALGDVDNDGDLDLFVTNLGPDALYLSAGDGTFHAAPDPPGSEGWSTSACFFDYDRDGWLDLYVATYLDFDPPKACTDKAGNPEFCGPEAFRGLPDRLFRNLAGGGFEDVSTAVLTGRPSNKGLGVICADLDGDARVDVYVANDGEPNQLWTGRGGVDGAVTLENRALILGAAFNLFSQPEASMGVAAGDVDGDGDLDLFMTHLDRETNTFYSNLGDAGFEDRTAASGLGPAGLPHTGFGTAFLDVENDGDLDLVAVNGRVRRGASLSGRAERRRAFEISGDVPPLLADYAEPNLLFLGDGGGAFSDAGSRAGRLASVAEVSRGLLAGDLDGDGDLDLVVTHCGGPARLYRNEAPRQGHWLELRAVDPELRRDALGAAVTVTAGGRSFFRPVISASSYLSAVQPSIHYGLGDAERVDGFSVVWPDGTQEAFSGGAADRRVTLMKGRGDGG